MFPQIVFDASENLHEALLNSLPQPLWIYHPETFSFLFVNEAAVATYDYSRKEFLSMTIKDIRPAEDVPGLLNGIARDGSYQRLVIRRHQKKSGLIIDVEIKSSSIEWSGQPARLVLVSDITERLKAEEELRLRKTLLEAQSEASPDGILIISADGQVLSYNKRFVEIWSIRSERLLSGSNKLLLKACAQKTKDSKSFLDKIKSLSEHPDDSSCDELTLKDGKTLDCYSTPIKTAQEKVYGRVWYFHDISASKWAEATVRESEDRYRDLVDNSQELICTHDLQGNLLSINPWASKILGYEPDELLKINMRDFLAPEFRKGFDDYLQKIEVDGVASGLMIVQTKEGKRRIWSYENSLRKEGVLVPIVRGMAHDVTEHKLAEQRLQVSEGRFRQLAENIHDVFWIVDVDKQEILYVSPAYEQIWGRTCRSLYDDPDSYLEAVHPEDRPQITLAMQRQRQGEHTQEEYRINRPDRSIRWIKDSAFPIRDEAGKIIRVVGLAEDITERKGADHTSMRLAAAVEQTGDSIMITDTKGVIQYVNPAFERITGYSKQEVIGQNPRILKSKKTSPETYEELWTTLKRGETWSGQLTNQRKDGSLYEERVTISPIRDSTGEIVNYAAVKQDITQRLQLEDQFRQAQKMEAVGKLAGGVAHDFNNLLTVITGYCDLALRKLKSGDPLRQNIDEIKKAGDRAAALTRQLLAFSRKQVLEPKVLETNAIISELVKMLQRLIGEDIHLDVSLRPGIGSIRADPGQIEQVLMNLAVNSRDAMPQGGKLIIETENVYLDEEYVASHVSVTEGRYVMIALSDTGSGMDAQTVERIFEPFFTTKELGHGTGLGLSTVYGIVKQSGGSIFVYSEVGLGTTIKIYLPRIDEAPDKVTFHAQHSELSLGSETILLVEDEEMVRKLARRILEACGYKVLEAPHGGVALLICERFEGPIHMILTDVVMPEMSGRELVQRLSSLRPEMRVLFMSGYTDRAVENHGVLESETHFIQKPFTTKLLSHKVRQALDGGFA
jgi:PAS domain S-box-containing protein